MDKTDEFKIASGNCRKLHVLNNIHQQRPHFLSLGSMIRRNRHETLETVVESSNKKCQPYITREECREKHQLRKYFSFILSGVSLLNIGHIDETLQRNHCRNQVTCRLSSLQQYTAAVTTEWPTSELPDNVLTCFKTIYSVGSVFYMCWYNFLDCSSKNLSFFP
jgi:hypothetical protein